MTIKEIALLEYLNCDNLVGEIKYCPDCEEYLPIKHFYKNKSRLDGHSIYCKKHSTVRRDESEIRNNNFRSRNKK